ncbi:MAG: LuxR C-terminal-related transcriptional regulator [Hoeflea sp.]|uniref:LuxR C-terminal-related transcriptional regulator n=1 Tax=Hoeflea sp. TaxID=1940281 RepID=UPI0032984855|tara:strand:+ start:4171 stop:4407 length:237 start_codon:yes stop_codon:yes gene_type:complete
MMDLGNERGSLPLTRTEMRCLRKCAEGLNDTEIGAGLELTAGEVASVLSVVMLKLRVPNRMAGVAKAARLGYLGTERD